MADESPEQIRQEMPLKADQVFTQQFVPVKYR